MPIARTALIRPGLRALCAVALLLIGAVPATGQVERSVDLELVLAVDVSASVDREEYGLQVQGLARAFRDPSVRAAIRRAGVRGIAVAVIQWAAGREQAVAIDWTWLNGDPSVAAFAARIAAMPRAFVGTDTVIAGAIRFGARQIAANRFDGLRRVIDVSGDGGAEASGLTRSARDSAVAAGVVINGLAIENEVADLRRFFRDHVIGGADAFAMSAAGYADFAATMRRKLIREIANTPIARANRDCPMAIWPIRSIFARSTR